MRPNLVSINPPLRKWSRRVASARRFVDNDQGWRILEKATVTPVRIASSESGAHMSPIPIAVLRRLKLSIKKIREVSR
jgi:hypothetical protein